MIELGLPRLGVVVRDGHGRVTRVNPAAARLLGCLEDFTAELRTHQLHVTQDSAEVGGTKMDRRRCRPSLLVRQGARGLSARPLPEQVAEPVA